MGARIVAAQLAICLNFVRFCASLVLCRQAPAASKPPTRSVRIVVAQLAICFDISVSRALRPLLITSVAGSEFVAKGALARFAACSL